MQDLNVIVYCREGSVDDAELKAYLQQFGEVIKVRIVFCKAIHPVSARGNPPSPNHDPFTRKPRSHHVYSTLG